MEKKLCVTVVEKSHEWWTPDNWRVLFQIPTDYVCSMERNENVVVPNDLRKQSKEMFSIVLKDDDEPVDYMEEYNQQLQFIKTAIKKELLNVPESLISFKDGKFHILFAFRFPDKSTHENFKQFCCKTEFVQLVTR